MQDDWWKAVKPCFKPLTSYEDFGSEFLIPSIKSFFYQPSHNEHSIKASKNAHQALTEHLYSRGFSRILTLNSSKPTEALNPKP